MTKPTPSFFHAVLLTLFLAIFYNTVTNMAGLYIVSDLGGSSDISVYPMVFFSLGNALTMPLAIPLANRFGPIRLLVIGLLLYTGFSLLCGFASNFFMFNWYRFGLGLSSGIFYILCRQLIFLFATPDKISVYAFISILMFAVVPVLGACFGASLAYESHWRWIFHVNEPLSLFLAAYFWFVYRKIDPPSQAPILPFDRVGYLFFFIGVGSLVSAAILSQQLDWYRSPLLVTLFIFGLPSLLFFVLWSWISPQPILELKLLKRGSLSFGLLSLSVLFSSYFGMIILISLWLNIYANYTPLWIAVLIGIMGIASLGAYFATKVFLQPLDPRFTLALAIFSLLISCYYSTYFDVSVDFFHLSVARSLAGMGLVMFLFPVFKLCFTGVPSEKDLPVFTLFQVVRALSSALGAALYVIVWQRRQVFFRERLGEGITLNSQLTEDYFQRASQVFYFSKEMATEQLSLLLDNQATSLALNDVFGLMGSILLGLLVLLLSSFFFLPVMQKECQNSSNALSSSS
jgi:DHA2 family multidrug resistance protein